MSSWRDGKCCLGDHTMGNSREGWGRDTPKAKANVRLKVLLKSVWQRCAARSQSPPSEPKACGRASKDPSGAGSLHSSARAVPSAIPAQRLSSESPSSRCDPVLAGAASSPPARWLPRDAPSSGSPVGSSAPAACRGSTSAAPRAPSAARPGGFYARLRQKPPVAAAREQSQRRRWLTRGWRGFGGHP